MKDIRTNANNDNNKPTYTRDGLKSLLKPSRFDFLLRDEYKYKSADGRHYILAIHEEGLDGKVIYDSAKAKDQEKDKDREKFT